MTLSMESERFRSVADPWALLLLTGILLLLPLPSDAALVLTAEEQAYLAQNPVIKIANDSELEPFEFVDERGQLSGVVADYIRLFEQKLGVKFDYVPNRPWSELNELVKTGERPVVMARHATEERKAYLNFTQSYMSFPVVIVGREGQDYVGSVHELTERVVAGVKGFNATDYLKTRYPEVSMLDVSSIQEGLRAVLMHRADVFVANLGSVNYAIKRHGLAGLQIIGQLHLNADFAIGVHKSDPVLLSIMQKALDDVTPQQASVIYDRWFQLRAINQLDQQQLWRLGFYVFIGFSALLLLMLWMRQRQRKQQHYINQINEYSYATLMEFPSFKLLWVSNSYAALVGCAPKKIVGKRLTDFAGERFSEAYVQTIESMLRSGQTWSGECEGVGCNGKAFWTLLTLTPQKNWLGEIHQVWGTRIDVTDKKHLERLSIVDELTGLYNRRQFNVVMDKEIRRAHREAQGLFLAILDVDYFKFINDTYGHQRGDEALVQLSDLLKTHFNRANDHVFRTGGEEFMIVTSGGNLDHFVTHLEALRESVFALQIPNQPSPLGVMSVSVGACSWQDLDSITADIMYQCVDQCLYQAKLQGRNRLVVCSSDNCSTVSVRG